jgi:hypothetical protein
MDSTLGNFYLQIQFTSFTAVVWIADNSVWRLIQCSPDGEWPQQNTWRRGAWTTGSNGMAYCYAMGSGSDAASPDNQTELQVFRLSQLEFPPDIGSNQGFWIKQFFIGPNWADAKNIQTGIVKTSPGHFSMPTHGSWMPFVTGPLTNAVAQKLRAYQDELQKMAIQMGLDVAAMVDPTGLCSIPASAYALRNGDYLGSAMNLLGVIPLFGKAAALAKGAVEGGRLAFLTKEVTFLKGWLEISVATGRRLRQTNQIDNALRVEIQGTTKATQLAKAADEAAGLLKNTGWIQEIYNSEKFGLLPEELTVLRRLADQGYYFVVRSCNKARVEWLRLGKQKGWGMIGKPVWLKTKSLKNVKFNGLVGFVKGDAEYRKVVTDMKQVKELPGSVDLGWLAARGMSAKDVKVFQLERRFNVPHVQDKEMMLSHYFVDTGDAYVLVDRFGRPYVPDIDIVTIQRSVGHGRFGPPGYKVGPSNPITPFTTADDAQFTAFWNKSFNEVGYPPGYQPFGWHGGRGGSAAFIGEAGAKFNPSTSIRALGWNPEKPEEDLIVAVKGVENLHDNVGFATGWDQLGNFQQANSGLGEWRFAVKH